MFMNFGKDMKLPSPDLEAIVERHKKNLQALDTAAKTAGSGASEIMARQRAMVQEALEEISAMAETVKGGGGPQSLMTAQAEFARRSFEAAIKNTSEIAGIAQKSSTEAFKVLAAEHAGDAGGSAPGDDADEEIAGCLNRRDASRPVAQRAAGRLLFSGARRRLRAPVRGAGLKAARRVS